MKDNFFGFAHYSPSYHYDLINQYAFDPGALVLDVDDDGNIVSRTPLGRQAHWYDYSPRVYEFLNYYCQFDPDDYDTTSEYFMGLEDYEWVRP